MQKSFFEAAFFSGNRDRLAQLTGAEMIIVTAHSALQKSADESMKFHQDPNFWYLTGLDDPDAVLVIDVAKREEFLIKAQRHEHHDLWDGVRDNDQFIKRSGITDIYESREGWAKLKQRLQAVKTIHTIAAPPSYLKFYDFYANPARRNLNQKLKRLAPKVKFEDIRLNMRDLRIVKQPQELAAIQKAIDITFIGLKAVKEARKDLKFEYEAEAILSYEYRRNGAEGHGFEPIVSAGTNAATVHYRQNNSPIKPDDPILLDTGAGVEHYSADISRTLLPETRMRERYLAVHEAIERVQKHAFSLLKPGIIHREYENQMEQAMGEELVKLGLIKEIDRPSVRRYFPHLTSHQLGLDLHDASMVDEPLAPGMVMTVEPGLYIPDEGIGVRIEEDIVITETGFRLLHPLGL